MCASETIPSPTLKLLVSTIPARLAQTVVGGGVTLWSGRLAHFDIDRVRLLLFSLLFLFCLFSLKRPRGVEYDMAVARNIKIVTYYV